MPESAPGLAEVLGRWSLDLPWIALIAGAGVLYVRAAWRVNGAGPRVPHPAWKTAAFLAGLALVAVAVLSPLEHYGNELLWANFAGFLVLTMMAAPLMVLGSPLTLAFRAAGPARRAELRAFYRRGPACWLTTPPVAWLNFAVVTYLWQFSSLAETAARHAVVRDLQQATLLIVALCFWMPAVAADPLRRRLPHPLRALYVLVEMTHKGLFGGMFLGMNHTFHSHFGRDAVAWGPDPMMDQRMAILILWIGGSLIFFAALLGIIASWMKYEVRNSARVDRRLAGERAAARRRKAALDQVFGNAVLATVTTERVDPSPPATAAHESGI